MIVPRNRLVFWVAVVVLPFAILGALEPAAQLLTFLAIGLLTFAAVVDALLAHGKLDGIRLDLPEVVRLSRDRAGAIDIQIHNPTERTHHLRLGLAFPPEIQSVFEEMSVTLPAGHEYSRVTWQCLPLKRGQYELGHAYLETVSPLGFWAVRAAAPVKSEIRVYPNLLTERKNLAAIFLNRGRLGIHVQRQVGKGRDFEKLREYIPGDSYDEIHWKATAKRGHPVTKVFQIERTQEVYVILDASRLTARQAAREGENAATPVATTVLERFMTAALVLGLAAEQQGDLFGLLTFSDRVEKFVRARNGQNHYNICRDALYTLEPRIVTPDFNEVTSFIRLRLRRRALLIFLTALDDPVLAENFTQHVDLIARQHLILVNMIKPPGADPLFTQPNTQTLDDLYQHLGGHLQWQNLRELEKVLQRRGVRFSLLENEKMSLQLVTQYLSVKQRQLL